MSFKQKRNRVSWFTVLLISTGEKKEINAITWRYTRTDMFYVVGKYNLRFLDYYIKSVK